MFGKRLKQLRKEFQLTQIELAEKIGINNSTLSDYERGDKKDPYASTLRALSNFFNVPIDYLLGESNIRDKDELPKLEAVFRELTEENRKQLYRLALVLRGEQNERNGNTEE